MKRLAILTTHPIQYHAPWFRALAAQPDIDLVVLFGHRATPAEQGAAGFGVEFDWDVSLLDGYPHRFLRNVAHRPSIHRFTGLDTPEISDIVREGKFDAVIVNGWHYKSAWQTMRACRRSNTPVMVRSDSHLRTERSLPKRAAKLPFYRWFIPRLDACLAVGTWSREYFLHYGARPDRVFVLPHVIDVDFFKSEAQRLNPQRIALRRQWQLDADATVFLFAGKFIQKKRPLDFVNAMANAKTNGTRIMGLMVGDGPLRKACEETVARTKAPIRFAGFLNQSLMPQAYAGADALVLPSDAGETWGLVVNEAMASRKPCLVSDQVGCGPDLIVPGETGEIFPVGDIQFLTSLFESYSRRERLQEMGARVERQTNRYSISAAVDVVVRAIDAVNNGSAK